MLVVRLASNQTVYDAKIRLFYQKIGDKLRKLSVFKQLSQLIADFWVLPFAQPIKKWQSIKDYHSKYFYS